MRLERILSAAVHSLSQGKRHPYCGEPATMNDAENVMWAMDYAEPGYDKPTNGIVFANWNRFPEDFDQLLERAGYAVEWSDEWSTCEDCNRAVRTSPNSYRWVRSYVIYNDCEILCANCVREDIGTYESYLLNNPGVADTFDVDWSERGFSRVNKDHYEHGLHPGQDDNPRTIAKALPPTVDYLFAIPTVGQFEVCFDCWIREKETKRS